MNEDRIICLMISVVTLSTFVLIVGFIYSNILLEIIGAISSFVTGLMPGFIFMVFAVKEIVQGRITIIE